MSPKATNPLLDDWKLWSKGPEALLTVNSSLIESSDKGYTAKDRIPTGKRLIQDTTAKVAKLSDEKTISKDTILIDTVDGPRLASSEVALKFAHSCIPNAFVSTGVDGVLNIHAIKDIPAGESVTISYLGDVALSSSERKKQLTETYNLTCDCPACILSEEEQATRDELVEKFETATTDSQNAESSLTEKLAAHKTRHDISVKLSLPLLSVTRDVVSLLASETDESFRLAIHTLNHLRALTIAKGSDSPESATSTQSLRKNKLPKSYNGEDAFLLRTSEFEKWVWGDDEILGNPKQVDDMLMQFSKTKPANRMRIKGEEYSDEEQYEGEEEEEEDEEEFFVRLWKKFIIPKKVLDAYIDQLERDMYGMALGDEADDGPACA